DRAARAACGRAVLRGVRPDTRLELDAVADLLRDGFGRSNAGEDPFDATIACIALAKLFLNGAVPEPPAQARRVEGWILGLGASSAVRGMGRPRLGRAGSRDGFSVAPLPRPSEGGAGARARRRRGRAAPCRRCRGPPARTTRRRESSAPRAPARPGSPRSED